MTDLSTDCRDGLLLAEIIEAVTAFKIPNLHKKPKSQEQMVSGIVIIFLFRKFANIFRIEKLKLQVE